jgi:hypothetical protein
MSKSIPRPRRRDPKPIGSGACELELTRGFVALIDEADAEMVSVCNWYASFNGHHPYPYVKGKLPRAKSPCRLHRYILGFPDGIVDHIDGDTLNNRRMNLRVVDPTMSNANTGIRRDSLNAFKGIRRNGNKFAAHIRCNGVRKYLGIFPTPIEAALAYDAAAIEAFGPFARTNAALGLITEASA